ncbi:tRNA (adenine(37)-N6)-methyltransferase-like [Mizuhopecten yessoensis]|uniref:Dolichol kinase n=1 Tax=Mizuhopecten yessoensis TaxID=6573 RepID=A0A210Q364_MIZYE|nr:tRNA (adenine(37)-N6)-methyltransferase-like [Mizuhopecten yessoensis]OWF43109.1 Dolichol kinase [Mizuhopecten yessoensis]
MRPIGVVSSLFTYKNGTPRQPSVCDTARGSITISKDVFNTPEHSLDGIQQYSHIWIIFEFHKNNNQYTKAKVRPPRLDGRRVGLFSTRSPYRPNPIGLTLAKLESVEGAKLHISGIDILDGSPVLDIKPYIPSYDCPAMSSTTSVTPTVASGDNDRLSDLSDDQVSDTDADVGLEDQDSHKSVDDDPRTSLNDQEQTQTCDDGQEHCSVETGGAVGCTKLQMDIQTEFVKDKQTVVNQIKESATASFTDKPATSITTEVTSSSTNHDISYTKSSQNAERIAIGTAECESESSVPVCPIKTADWVNKPPIDKLTVRFTLTAEQQLTNFSKSTDDLDHRLEFLESCEEARSAICQILTEDPRSVYRRRNCSDSLYFFAVDKVHVTCWFDEHMVEVVRIKPVSQVKHLQTNK